MWKTQVFTSEPVTKVTDFSFSEASLLLTQGFGPVGAGSASGKTRAGLPQAEGHLSARSQGKEGERQAHWHPRQTRTFVS